MKPSRRSRLAASATSKRPKTAPMSPPKPQPQPESSPNNSPTAKPQVQSTTTLTAAARYQKNLKNLRRMDPTILSIIDQFSHICLYRLHEGKWTKDGYEGASFLFERAAYPPYGLFILNRAGMYDYIHPIHPEDELQSEGEYLMYRSYPEFTARRLALAKLAHPTFTESWTDACRRTPSANDPLTNWRYLLNQESGKGDHETVMFWFLGSDSEQHEPLSDTMERLMTFIRKGEPYPYNLDRPPPPLQRSTVTDVKSQDGGTTSTPLSEQSNAETLNGTGSEIDKLFSKLRPATWADTTPSDGKVTLATLFASAAASLPTSTRASSTPVPNLVTPSLTTVDKSRALLDTIFASATPPQGPIPAPTPPFPHHVSSEPFPPPPSAPPSTRPTFATAHLRGDVSSSEPESPGPRSPTTQPAAAHLIHSPQPTTSQLPQILTQDVISALLGMPPSRTSSVASSHRRYEGDVESSDDLHEADSPVDERPLSHANRNRKHELGDVTPRPPLRGFASSEKVLPSHSPASAPASALPSHHSAPSVLPSAASSTPSVPAPLQLVPDAVAPAPNSAPAATRVVGTSPAPRPLVPFHHEDSSLWPYPRAPLDDRDDIVELDFADTSALSDVDAFERRLRNGKHGAKLSKLDREREREAIERSWDVPAHPLAVGSNNNNAGTHAVLGRPPQSAPQTGALKANHQPKPAAQVKALETSTAGGPAVAPANDNNKSKSKAKVAANGSDNVKGQGQAPASDMAPAATGNGALGLARSTASTAIVDAIYAHSNGNAPLPTTDRNEFVREVLTLIHTDPSFVDRLWTEYRARA